MPNPKIRFYLHSKTADDGRRPVYLSVGVGETRPVRQATGVVVLFALETVDIRRIMTHAEYSKLSHQQLLAL